jgi:hypothetical protein
MLNLNGRATDLPDAEGAAAAEMARPHTAHYLPFRLFGYFIRCLPVAETPEVI